MSNAAATTDGRLPQHILIAGINYAPEETGIAPYTTALAEHLAARGCRVTALTGMPHYPQWRIDAGYAGRTRMRETIGGVDVRRFRHFVPGEQSAWQRGLYEGTFLAHGLALAGVRRPDVVIGIVPSLSGGFLAAAAARRFGAPLGLLFQDLMGQAANQSGMPGADRVANVTRRAEGWLARQASGIAVIAQGFRPYLEAAGVKPDRIRRVRNWTHIDDVRLPVAVTRARLGWSADATVCLHAGNIGYKQGLENVVAAARLALRENPRLQFVVMGDGNQRAHLEELAAGLPNVHFLPPQPGAEFPEVLAAADVLLVNQRGSVREMSLPSKLTSYMAAGRPIVAAVAAGSETALELATADAGVVVDADAPAQLLAAITSLMADPDRAAALGRRGKAYAHSHLTAAAALAQFERFIGGVVRPPGRPERFMRGVRPRSAPAAGIGADD